MPRPALVLLLPAVVAVRVVRKVVRARRAVRTAPVLKARCDDLAEQISRTPELCPALMLLFMLTEVADLGFEHPKEPDYMQILFPVLLEHDMTSDRLRELAASPWTSDQQILGLCAGLTTQEMYGPFPDETLLRGLAAMRGHSTVGLSL